MTNQKNQQLSDIDRLAISIRNKQISYPFRVADGSFLEYSLELVRSDKIPLTFSCSFSTTKLINGVKRGRDIEICQLIVYGDQVGIVIKNKKPLSKKACQTINVNNVSRVIATHADVIIFRAIPEWMTEAADLVSSYSIEPIWLITVNLLKQSKLKLDALWDFDKEKTNFSPFSKEEYSRAVIVSQEQAPNHLILQRAITCIPEAYERLQEFLFEQDEIIIPVEPYKELSSGEQMMDEKTAEARDCGGAK